MICIMRQRSQAHKVFALSEHNIYLFFATTVVDLLLIELMLHLTHEFISCVQIIRRRADLTETPQ